MAKPMSILLTILSLTCHAFDGGSLDGGSLKVVKPDVLCGTWVRTQKTADGSLISLMKIFTPTHFAVFQQDSANIKTDAFQAHSGRYLVTDGVLVETYEFSSTPAAVGKSGKCRIVVDGDKLRQTWTLKDGSTVVEEWNRLPALNAKAAE